MVNKLYQEELMEHFKYPKNKIKLDNPDFFSDIHNPSCGDSVSIQGMLKKDSQTGDLIISQLAFDGSGCVISQATASMLTQFCKNKTVKDILNLNKDDILKLIKIELGPTRLRCALLALQALQDALQKYVE
ncbi:MAG: iron-sulfur cluster assembly scaffold protein [Candidatus Babeliales bacterium]